MNTLSIHLSSNFNFSDYININNLFIAVVVLAFIILIMCVTYFISIKPNLNQNTSGANAGKEPSNTKGMEGKNLVDDSELVAVITAAIYASMGDEVPAGGFVVRSIHRTNHKKWMNS